MRCYAVCLAVLSAAIVYADSRPNSGFNWYDRAASLGVTRASIVIEYSLTDDCNLGRVRTRNSTSAQFFNAQAIDRIVEQIVGPFESPNDQLISQNLAATQAPQSISMTKRMFAWSTSVGHSHIVCTFYLNGDLATATLVGLNLLQTMTVDERPVTVRLSTLGTNQAKFSFRIEE